MQLKQIVLARLAMMTAPGVLARAMPAERLLAKSRGNVPTHLDVKVIPSASASKVSAWLLAQAQRMVIATLTAIACPDCVGLAALATPMGTTTSAFPPVIFAALARPMAVMVPDVLGALTQEAWCVHALLGTALVQFVLLVCLCCGADSVTPVVWA